MIDPEDELNRIIERLKGKTDLLNAICDVDGHLYSAVKILKTRGEAKPTTDQILVVARMELDRQMHSTTERSAALRALLASDPKDPEFRRELISALRRIAENGGDYQSQ